MQSVYSKESTRGDGRKGGGGAAAGRQAGRQADFLFLSNVVKSNGFIVLLDSNLRLEIIYNEVNKLLGPKNGRVQNNADHKDGHNCVVV